MEFLPNDAKNLLPTEALMLEFCVFLESYID